MIENKETISFDEFRAWLTGLIVGKRGAIPDLEDWKMIKKMMDKVVAGKEYITVPVPSSPSPEPYNPWRTDPDPYQPYWAPYASPNTGTPPYPPGAIWYGAATTSGNVSSEFVDQTIRMADTAPFTLEDLDAAFDMLFTSNKK